VLDEGDVERIMRHPQTMIASDGRLSRPGEGHPHPRAYGTFPRVLARYVRERQLLTLEDAIKKMTSMPAATLHLTDRGRLVAGARADLTIFSADSVSDRATFQDPHQYPAGIPYVIVNGALAVDGGRFTGSRAGHVLRRGRA
jgi:dihydroorotase/N-acyl-D-amino-acid deacylase